MVKVLVVILVIWLAWLGYQYFTKSEAAFTLIHQKIEELDSTDTDTLLEGIGRGYSYQEVEIKGYKYRIRWIIIRPSFAGNIEDEGSIEIRGRVDFIDLLPFGDFKYGSPFQLIIKIKE